VKDVWARSRKLVVILHKYKVIVVGIMDIVLGDDFEIRLPKKF